MDNRGTLEKVSDTLYRYTAKKTRKRPQASTEAIPSGMPNTAATVRHWADTAAATADDPWSHAEEDGDEDNVDYLVSSDAPNTTGNGSSPLRVYTISKVSLLEEAPLPAELDRPPPFPTTITRKPKPSVYDQAVSGARSPSILILLHEKVESLSKELQRQEASRLEALQRQQDAEKLVDRVERERITEIQSLKDINRQLQQQLEESQSALTSWSKAVVSTRKKQPRCSNRLKRHRINNHGCGRE